MPSNKMSKSSKPSQKKELEEDRLLEEAILKAQAERAQMPEKQKCNNKGRKVLDEEKGLKLIDKIMEALYVEDNKCDFCCKQIDTPVNCRCKTVTYCSHWCRRKHYSVHCVLCKSSLRNTGGNRSLDHGNAPHEMSDPSST